ncbi:MAG: succinate dehydrogenase/fumarate reductase cytochrome b subunit, partial [Desulfovibrionales bacterium]
IHMWVVLTDLPIMAAKSAARVQNGWWLLFYLILLPMVELHVSVGFYRIGVKWGFIRSDNRDKGKKLEYWLLGIFVTIGLLTLLRLATLSVAVVG